MEKIQKRISQRELNYYLKSHKEWCETNGKAGTTLSLPNVDLSGLSFKDAMLRGANLTQCNLQHCDFSGANLNSINVTESDFTGANLSNADLSSTDFKYILLDETTLFEDCIYEKMMIDLPTAKLLPDFMDFGVMQLIEEFRFVTNILFPREHAHIGRAILDDLTTILQTKYEEVKIKVERSSTNEAQLSIDARSEDDRAKIEQDMFNFGRVLRDEVSIEYITDDPLLAQRFQLNTKFRQMQLELEKKLYIENNLIGNFNSTFGDLVGSLSKQLSNNLLPAGANKTERADFIVTLKSGHKKTIDTEKIVFIEKEKDASPKIYFENKETIEFEETMSSVATRLQTTRPTIMTTHKGFIINLSYINKKINVGNNYEVFSNGNV